MGTKKGLVQLTELQNSLKNVCVASVCAQKEGDLRWFHKEEEKYSSFPNPKKQIFLTTFFYPIPHNPASCLLLLASKGPKTNTFQASFSGIGYICTQITTTSTKIVPFRIQVHNMPSLSFCHLGIARVRSGDLIRCTVLFEQHQEIDGIGQIPVVFSVNGTRLVAEGGQIFIKHNPNKPWYPYIGFDQKNSALAKVKVVVLSTFQQWLYIMQCSSYRFRDTKKNGKKLLSRLQFPQKVGAYEETLAAVSLFSCPDMAVVTTLTVESFRFQDENDYE